jgi:predicted regulator of Ras-like GTPase activity (Roadblock/LC7/MglB family)
VHYAGLYKDGEQLASSFPADKNESMIETAEIIEQTFSALESIQKTHNEMYFSIGNQYLAAFRLHEEHFAVLLTEKKINFPLIHMGIKSASAKIRHLLEEEKKKQALEAQAQALEAAATSGISTSTALVVPTESSILAILDQYSAVLTSFLGPAARFVVEDCVDEWKQKYVQNKENLGFLVELIQKELDSDDEKERFAQQIKLVVG